MIKDMAKLAVLSMIVLVAYVSVGFEQFVVMAFTLMFFYLFVEGREDSQTKK